MGGSCGPYICDVGADSSTGSLILGAVLYAVLFLLMGIYFYYAGRSRPRDKGAYEREFQRVRRDVLARDGHRCQMCGTPNALHVHHRQPRAHGGQNNPSNLVTLCRTCHGKVHGRRL